MEQHLTSTTAPGIVFSTRSELAEHYKSDWHKYNLKRRQAGLPVLLKRDFEARLEAARALQQEKKTQKFDHLKDKKTKLRLEAKRDRKLSISQQTETSRGNKETPPKEQHDDEPSPMEEENELSISSKQLEEESKIEIDPKQCLFDRHISSSVEANVERMARKYGFFLPDREYLTDVEGFVGFCHEKIKLGHMCLYCQRVFTTWQGTQKHMVSVNHTKVAYEVGSDLEDLSVFYDFSLADADFLTGLGRRSTVANDSIIDAENADDDGWEDISDDDQEMADADEMDDEEDDIYEGYEEEISQMGFDVTPLGELVFPDGRIIGHRSFRRYYKQRAPRANDSAAVSAARQAAGERLFRGRVYQLGYESSKGNSSHEASSESALSLAKAGIAPGMAAGRAGKGILVPSGAGGAFSQLSIYRYRAAVRKQRRGDMKGQKVFNKTKQNMNKMDKKHNRLMNGVSVAHAAR